MENLPKKKLHTKQLLCRFMCGWVSNHYHHQCAYTYHPRMDSLLQFWQTVFLFKNSHQMKLQAFFVILIFIRTPSKSSVIERNGKRGSQSRYNGTTASWKSVFPVRVFCLTNHMNHSIVQHSIIAARQFTFFISVQRLIWTQNFIL